MDAGRILQICYTSTAISKFSKFQKLREPCKFLKFCHFKLRILVMFGRFNKLRKFCDFLLYTLLMFQRFRNLPKFHTLYLINPTGRGIFCVPGDLGWHFGLSIFWSWNTGSEFLVLDYWNNTWNEFTGRNLGFLCFYGHLKILRF